MDVQARNYLDEPIIWNEAIDAEYPYECTYDGARLKIRVNDFPAEHLYSLLVQDNEIASFDDWPANWVRDHNGEKFHQNDSNEIPYLIGFPPARERRASYFTSKDTSALEVVNERVAVSSAPKIAQTILLLFEALSKAYNSRQLPVFLFEKFCVLALSVVTDNKDLSPLQAPEIRKGFHLYGARTVLNRGKREEFLLDWAVEHGVLSRLQKGPEINEKTGNLLLMPRLEEIYPHKESPWDEDVRDAVEELALLTKAIYETKGLRDSALIALTSLASDRDLHRAVEAELDLWLHHPRFSVYDSLNVLTKLATVSKERIITERDLGEANFHLSQTANFTAQVNRKLSLAHSRESLFLEIDRLASDDVRMRRFWRRLRTGLDRSSKSEEGALGVNEILFALRMALLTNNLLRDLLALAGHKDSKKRSKPLNQSVNLVRLMLNEGYDVDHTTRMIFAAKPNRPDIDQMLGEILTNLRPRFPDTLAQLRPVLLEIAYRCEEVLVHYAS